MPAALRAIGLIGLLALQVALAISLRHTRPHWDVLPPAPTERALGALSFGDREFLYRKFVLDLQNFGDTGGRNTPLRDYDMDAVVQWLEALDKLDFRANHHITLAGRYFSQTQDRPQVRKLVAYLRRHIDRDPAAKVQWIAEALLLARTRLKDDALVLELADQLAGYDNPSMSITAYLLPAGIYENAGRIAQAADLAARAVDRLKGRISAEDERALVEYMTQLRQRAASLERAKSMP